jgi:putative oxidoreductase
MVFFLETVGAVCIILGLFTRFFAAAIGIQFLLIIYAHWAPGFGWNRPGGGWEYPLFWGLIWLAIGCAAAAPIRWTASSGGSCEEIVTRGYPLARGF